MQQNRPLKTGSVCCYLPSRTTNFRKLQANQVLTDRRFLRWLAGFQGDTEWISWPNRHNNRPSPCSAARSPYWSVLCSIKWSLGDKIFKEKSFWWLVEAIRRKKSEILSTRHDDLYSTDSLFHGRIDTITDPALLSCSFPILKRNLQYNLQDF